jgi:2-succinyl-5-enolpyruvyl-6-hydroxy-3-cyclohexene-1-carboxylate synthase
MSAALIGEWSRLLAASLAQAGIVHAVVCPGSRSTPFAWALAERSELVCHSLIDERDAAFFALGIARVTGGPVLVLATSGSAAANFFPAIVEARLARLPLLVVTADRPLELQAAESAQTIDQVKLYGDQVRGFFDLGAPDPAPSALSGLQRVARQAVALTLGPEPGPVHLNARARKPLEPAAATTPSERALVTAVDRLVERGVTALARAERVPPPSAIAELARELGRAERGLIVCGPLPVSAERTATLVRGLAARLNVPVFAEATSGLRFTDEFATGADAFDWLVRSAAFRSAIVPDCVLRIGAPPTCSGLDPWLTERPDIALHVVAEHGHPDALGRARSLTIGPLERSLEALTAALDSVAPNTAQRGFTQRFANKNALAWRAVRAVSERTQTFGEPEAVRHVVESLPAGGLLVLGNSLPVRLVDAFVPAGGARIRVASQRGANGIDGLVAGAAGSALAAGCPTLLLLGDVSLAHDLGGLAAARLVRTPLALVVLDNGGGRIFEQLPVAKLWERAPERAELWLTPPGIAFEHAAAAFGLPYAAPRDGAELRACLGRAFEHHGATLVHVRVSEHGARDTLGAVLAELERTLAESDEPGKAP